MKNEVAVIDPQEFKLEKQEAEKLTTGLAVTLKEREVFISEYEELIKVELTTDTIKLCRDLRLRIVKNRTKGIEAWHKTSKDYFLQGGRFVDAIKNKEIAVNIQMEEKLLEAETFFERIEAEKQEKLKTERLEKLSEVCDNAQMYPVGMMEQEAFDELFNGLKLAKEARISEALRLENERIEAEKKAEAERIALEKKAEAERIEKEKQEQIEREKIEKENAQLKAEKEAKEIQDAKRNKDMKPYIIFIRDYSGMLSLPEVVYQKELADIKKGAELQWEFERKEQIRLQKEAEEKEQQLRIEREKQAKIQAEKDAEANRIKAENERLAKELQAKKEAEEAEQKRLAEIEKQKQLEADKLAKSSDKVKLEVWVRSMTILGFETEGVSSESKALSDDILAKFTSFKAWAINQIEKM